MNNSIFNMTIASRAISTGAIALRSEELAP
jgi:hypothetical protein